jgi:hypothetical protein
MVQAPPKSRKRLTQAQALQQVREQIKEAEARPKPNGTPTTMSPSRETVTAGLFSRNT